MNHMVSRKKLDSVKVTPSSGPSFASLVEEAEDLRPGVPTSPERLNLDGVSRDKIYHEVDVRLIDENPFNARYIYLPSRVDEIAANIAQFGQDTPGIATIRNGRYILVDGLYRLKGIRKIGKETMDLIVREGLTDQQMLEYSFRENHERKSQTALDNALAWSDALKRSLYVDQADLARGLALKEDIVSMTLSVLKLSSQVLEYVRQEPDGFSYSILNELVKYETVTNAEMALVAAYKIGQGDLTRRELIAMRQTAEESSNTHLVRGRKKAHSNRYPLQDGGVHVGLLKEWDAGRVVLDVKLTVEKRKGLMELIRTFFQNPAQ